MLRWGFRACLKTTQEKVLCVSGEQDEGFWEPAAAVSRYGHSGASLGQSRPSQLRCCSPGDSQGVWKQLFLCLGVLSRWQWAVIGQP